MVLVVRLAALVAGPASAEVPVAAHVGYAFRIADPATDDRAHSVVGGLVVDGPPLLWGFSGRAEGFVHAWPAGDARDTPLLLAGGAASATYVFDDTGTRAIAAVGAFGGAVVDGEQVVMAWGPLAALTLRMPLTEGVFAEARLSVPLDLSGTLLPVGTAGVGLAFAPDILLQRALRGEGPADLAVDAGVPLP